MYLRIKLRQNKTCLIYFETSLSECRACLSRYKTSLSKYRTTLSGFKMTLYSFVMPLSNFNKPSRRRDGLMRRCETAKRIDKFVALGSCGCIYKIRRAEPSRHLYRCVSEAGSKNFCPKTEISQKKLPVCLILAHYSFIFAPVNAP